MKSGKALKTILALLAICMVMGISPITAKAEDDYYDEFSADYILGGAAETSLTVDVTKYYNRSLRELEHEKQCKCKLVNVSYACTDKTSRYDFENLDYKSVDKNATRFTIKKLNAGTGYLIYVKITVKSTTDNTEYKFGYWKRTATLSKSLKTVNLKDKIVDNVTDTTAAISFGGATDKIQKEYKDMEFSYDDYSIGFCKIKNNKEDDAYNTAKTMAWENRVTVNTSLGKKYTITGLEPNTSYAVCVLIRMSIHDEKGENYKYGIYYARGKFKTKKDDGLEETDGPCTVRSSDWEYRTYYKDILDDIHSNNYYCDFQISKNNTSITIDWSKDAAITKALDNTICIGYVEETVFNVMEDEDKYGRSKNFGKNIRDAYTMAKTRKIIVPSTASSYTIGNLDPNKKYAIVIRHGLKSKDYSKNLTYTYMRHVSPQAAVNSSESESKSVKLQSGYMFDVKASRVEDGTAVVLDWTDMIKAFESQKELGNYLADYDERAICTVYYREMDENLSKSDLNEIYMAFNRNYMYGTKATRVNVEQSRKKKKIYGLDKNKKYLFVIQLKFYVYLTGGSYMNVNPIFYYDESRSGGDNYFKSLKKNGVDPFSQHSKGTKTIDVPENGITITGDEVKYISKTVSSGTMDDIYKKAGTRYSSEYLYDFEGNGDNDLSIKFSSFPDSVKITMLKSDYLSGRTVKIYLPQSEKNYYELWGTDFEHESHYYYDAVILRFPVVKKAEDQSAASDSSSKSSEEAKKDDSKNPAKSDSKADNSKNKQDNTSNQVKKSNDRNKSKIKYLTKKKNHAWITIDNDTIKSSKVKKKAQKVEIGIENSKGKIKVKNVSSKKLKKYIDYKIKKGKVIVTIKKGAKKGTYKLKVTVNAKNKSKKTNETVKIVVK